jgi:hypothetical protein
VCVLINSTDYFLGKIRVSQFRVLVHMFTYSDSLETFQPLQQIVQCT